MRRLVLFTIILITVISIPTYASAQNEIKVFSIDDVIGGNGKALLFAGYQILTDCESQQGCWKAGKLDWYLYENGNIPRYFGGMAGFCLKLLPTVSMLCVSETGISNLSST